VRGRRGRRGSGATGAGGAGRGSLVRLAGVLLLAALPLLGCMALTGKTAGETLDDATVTTTVKARLAAEKIGTVLRIDVDTNHGMVYLTGTVESAAARARAVEVARQVKGVRGVVDNLRVQRP
jgi:hyperosmotically inducible periplasmic protein